ncbi:Nn.00g075530.m01.CDS01 [Neocucurbitaria sp. VM-36]
MGHHQQQLALFVLPPSLGDTEDDPEDRSQGSLGIGDYDDEDVSETSDELVSDADSDGDNAKNKIRVTLLEGLKRVIDNRDEYHGVVVDTKKDLTSLQLEFIQSAWKDNIRGQCEAFITRPPKDTSERKARYDELRRLLHREIHARLEQLGTFSSTYRQCTELYTEVAGVEARMRNVMIKYSVTQEALDEENHIENDRTDQVGVDSKASENTSSHIKESKTLHDMNSVTSREERKRIIAEMKAEIIEQEEERQSIIAENEAKIIKQEREAKEARQRAVDDYNRKREREAREAKEERERIIFEYERKRLQDSEEDKYTREELIIQLRLKEEWERRREKKEYEAFLYEQKKKEEEDKARKAAQEKDLRETIRKRLARLGFEGDQIQSIMDEEKKAAIPDTHGPIYAKCHQQYLDIETLRYYDIPYEVDVDPDYLIVLREMSQRETEILFEHTRRLRSKKDDRLVVDQNEGKGKTEEYASGDRSKGKGKMEENAFVHQNPVRKKSV